MGYSPSCRRARAGMQGRILKAGTEAENTGMLSAPMLTPGLLSCLPYTLQDYLQAGISAQCRSSSVSQQSGKHPNTCPQASLRKAVPQLRFLLPE